MDSDIMHELSLMLNVIGTAIDNGLLLDMDDLNELWQWIDSLLGREA